MSIKDYIKSKQNAWAPSTLASEERRLAALSEHLEKEPEDLWNSLSHLGPYSRTTAWIRICDYWDFKLGGSPNKYKAFRKANARLFKHVYERKTPEISFEEALQRISQIQDPEVRKKAEQLLVGGLRFQESTTIQSGYCIGKGSKKRRVFVDPVAFDRHVETFRRHLKEDTGLKPHDLRKIRITQLVRNGADHAQICAIAGWESFNTASSYINAGKEEDLKKLMEVE